MNETQFNPVLDLDALGALFERSHTEAVLIFLHAPHCPVGVVAYHSLLRAGATAAIINVARQQALTAAIETRTGIRHESPQIILIRDGRAVWSASHYEITPAAVISGLQVAA